MTEIQSRSLAPGPSPKRSHGHKTFFKAALDTVEQLKSYLKKRPELIVRHA